MRGSFKKSEAVIIVLGLLFIITAAVLNEFTIAKIFSQTGFLRFSDKILVWIFDTVLFAVGAVVILFYKNTRVVANLALLLISVVVCAVFAECFLRFLEPKNDDIGIFRENPNKTGSYRLIPGLNLNLNVLGKDISIKTNAKGMRWKEAQFENPLNKKRIAFVGDSFAFGFWADDVKNSFVGVFDSLIDGKKYEVMNFGVPGYGPSDIELQIKEDILPFKPDYLILMFWNGNDFMDTYLGINRYYVEDGRLKLRKNADSKFISKIEGWISGLSLYNLFYNSINSIKGRSMFGFKNPVSPSIVWSRKVYPDYAKKAKDLTIQAIDNIKRLCDNNGVQLIIVDLPFMEQVYSRKLVYDDYDFNLPSKYLEDYARANSVPCLNLLPVLRENAKHDSDIYIKNDVHFNDKGHRLIGQLIAEYFKKEIVHE